MTKLPICHFNDVYRVTPQKISPTSSDTIDVTQFSSLLNEIRDRWPEREDGKRDGKQSSFICPVRVSLSRTIQRSGAIFG